MATWEQRRRGILRTALELERDLFNSENLYIGELRASLTDTAAELRTRLAMMNAQPRGDGNFDWERWQVESLIAEVDRSMDFWRTRATSTVQAGTTAADEMGAQYPLDILSAGGSSMRVQPRLGNPALAAFHAYDAGLIRGVSDKARADVTGIIRRAALGGDSVFNTLQRIGDVTGKGAFATAFHRGEAIIRTEMGRAYSSADMWTMNQARLDHPGLKKKWLSVIDGRVRPEHAAAHDQVRELDEPFVVAGENLMHPHDTNGSAWNTINCRCKAVPWDPAWEKLPPPGVAPELGPLTLPDRQGFDPRLRELDRLGQESRPLGVKDHMSFLEWDEASRWLLDGRTVWPTPRNPAYWRTKPSFTLDELKMLAASERTFAGFLRERYGITAAWDQRGVQHETFKPDLRLAIERALETYRALDPKWVVENPHLRYIVSSTALADNVGGEADVFGNITLNQKVLLDKLGQTRDPNGVNLPRLSDDAMLEAVLHEIGHTISYTGGIGMTDGVMGLKYNALAPLPQDAWSEYYDIHNASTGVGAGAAVTEELRQQALASLEQQMEAYRQMGWTDVDLAPLELERRRLDEWYSSIATEPFPSDYAQQNMHEDFAESVALALLQPAEFKSGYPARYAWFQQYYPNLVK